VLRIDSSEWSPGLVSDRRTIDKKDPDLYITGGVASSGKSEVMVKIIPERTVSINNDSFKGRLARRTKSPLKRFHLAHSALLHNESDILVNRSINKSIRESRDVTLDVTLANLEKNKQIIERYKMAGYDLHLLGTQKQPHIAIENSTSRFIRKGRYVPPSVIAEKGNVINRNVMAARNITDSHIIADTTTKRKPIFISRSKKDLTHNFRDPKE